MKICSLLLQDLSEGSTPVVVGFNEIILPYHHNRMYNLCIPIQWKYTISNQRCSLWIPFNPGRLLKYCTVLIVGVPYWYDSLLYSWHSKDGESAWLYIPPVVNDHTARCIICLWLWSSPWRSSAIWFPFGGQVFVIIETGACKLCLDQRVNHCAICEFTYRKALHSTLSFP